LVNGFDAWVETPGGTLALSSQHYAPDVIYPDGAKRIESFAHEPWPRWRFRLTDELAIEQELFVRPGESSIFVGWRIAPLVAGSVEPGQPNDSSARERESTPPAIKLFVRPFFSGRDFHSMHHENGALRFAPEQSGERSVWRLYDGLPAVIAQANGSYRHEPSWYRNFLYREEQSRGLDAIEDCAAPGVFEFDLALKPGVLMFGAEGHMLDPIESVETLYLLARTM
jgi:glycogen debranching enzyme